MGVREMRKIEGPGGRKLRVLLLSFGLELGLGLGLGIESWMSVRVEG